ncbi:peptidylprolyl isomerase [Pseudofulvimonas gallinarii]|uniref:peptidylprolyl isomerase n=1 Tax=Pseudofulvimonas gallinarii TaxID=634155 RepID=A0A4R3LJL4_9GAMM|nr:peptidylprolyl isomerase [Pseudofulvimonas gallinarii]TCT00383.1 parvulin-like peptidyl-prolyl isomerase [Pseudofulvimonas gallinarii]
MKRWCTVVLALVNAISAQALAQPLVWRGDTVITLEELDARLNRLPDGERATYTRDTSNIARLLDQLLVNRALAEEARELGLDKDPEVQKDIQFAVEELLAIHRLNLLLRDDAMPDFGALAEEQFLADSGKWDSPESLAVQHVLIRVGERLDDDAAEIAREVLDKARSGTNFDKLVEQYSDDPSKLENKGRFVIVDDTRFDPAFVAGARALVNDGDVGEPVRSAYGYHIIKLIRRSEARKAQFSDVRSSIERDLRNQYRENARKDYLRMLRSRMGAEEGNEELLMSLPVRYGGRPEIEQGVR